MVDTIRLLAELQALFPSGVPSGTSAQDLRDFLVSAVPSGRGATVVVASSSASALRKAQADFVCSGVADDVKVQEAIDALPAGGGKVALTEGSFNIAAPIVPVSDLALQGAGMRATKLILANGVNDYMFKSATAQEIGRLSVDELEVDGNKANQSAGGGFSLFRARHCHFKRVWVGSCFEYGIGFGGDYDYGYQNVVEHCVVGGCASGVHIGYTDENFIHHCLFSYNTAYGLVGTSGLDGVDECVFVANPVGARFPDCHDMRILGNTFDGQTGNALELSNSQRNQVIGNHFSGTGTGSAPGIYDDIHNSYSGAGNLFEGNIFNSGLARYCIYADGSGGAGYFARARILGNDFGAYTTAPLSLAAGEDIRVRDNGGYINENGGAAASVADGGTIAHGLVATPGHVEVTLSVAGEIVSVTAVGPTTFTVAIKKHDGTVGTTQTLYWRASV